MTRTFSAAFVLVLLASLSMTATAHDPKQHAAPAQQQVNDEAQPVVAVVEAFSSALRSGDLARAGELLADGVLILESGGAEHSREEYLGGHATRDAAFLKGTHSEIKQRSAHMEGAIAWVGTESELHATRGGKPLTLLSTETMVLKQGAKGWRIVHIHWSSRPKKD